MTKMLWENAENLIKENKNKIYFLFFTLEADQNCKLMRNIISEVEDYFNAENEIKFIEIDAKESEMYLQPNTKFQLLEVPTFCVIKEGKIAYLGHNFYPKEILIDWIFEVMD